MSVKKKMGVLGGRLNPTHFGHLNLALSLMESCKLDGVFFVPAGISPFKEKAPPIASGEHRLEMVKRAIAPIQEFCAIDWEVRAPGPSYTIHTVRKLAEDQSLELHLLIGSDHVASLDRWKEVDKLLHLAPPFVGTRSGSELQHLQMGKEVGISLLEISSTSIRARLSKKKYCGHLVPGSVLDYIAHHHLY
jgi:nicotinate-nucleotide adenylyltransferase